MTRKTHSVPPGSDIWDGTKPRPLAEFSPYKLSREDRSALEAAYNAHDRSNYFHMPDEIWPDLNMVLSQHRTQRDEWDGDEPKTRIDRALLEFDRRLELDVREIENLMFNNWLRTQFEPDRERWATLKQEIKEARSRIQSYRNQIDGRKFRRTTRRKLHAETTTVVQNFLSRHGLSLVATGSIQRLDVRRRDFLEEFFRIAEDRIDDVRGRRLLDGIANAIRQKQEA